MTLIDHYQRFLAETGSEVAAAIFALDAHQKQLPATPQRTVLAPPQAAKQIGVDPATVIGWIRSGQLKAANVGQGELRPRYRIQQSDLDAFWHKRRPDKPAPRKARTKPNSDVIEFF